jgi:hypothetical protein
VTLGSDAEIVSVLSAETLIDPPTKSRLMVSVTTSAAEAMEILNVSELPGSRLVMVMFWEPSANSKSVPPASTSMFVSTVPVWLVTVTCCGSVGVLGGSTPSRATKAFLSSETATETVLSAEVFVSALEPTGPTNKAPPPIRRSASRRL